LSALIDVNNRTVPSVGNQALILGVTSTVGILQVAH
jgi:hypothetical protein